MSPRLCFDVSNTLETASLSGIQRVTLELISALSDTETVMLDGRSGDFRPLSARQLKRLERLRSGDVTHRSIVNRLETRATRSSAPLPRHRPFSFDAEAVLFDLEASWHAPIQRAELLPHLGAHTAALIHDILPITNPEWFPPTSVSRFRSWFDAHVTAGSALLAVSRASADAVADAGAPRPTVIRMGGPPPSATTPAAGTTPARPRSNRSGILMIGTIEPRKGHAIVLDALDLLGDDAPVVDVVGRPGWDTDELISRLDRHSHVRWHRDLGDADLNTLWSLTGLLLQPSLGEGFGLPVAEALQRGVAVASSDIPVMREVGRDQTLLLPLDPAQWADALSAFATDPSAWPRPHQLGWPRWSDSAVDTIEALRSSAVWPDAGSVSQ